VRTFADKVSSVDVRTFWCKNFKFFKIYGVSARTRKRGVNFSQFYEDVFYGRPLSTNLHFLLKYCLLNQVLFVFNALRRQVLRKLRRRKVRFYNQHVSSESLSTRWDLLVSKNKRKNQLELFVSERILRGCLRTWGFVRMSVWNLYWWCPLHLRRWVYWWVSCFMLLRFFL